MIILEILKIIGIVLACIVGLVLLVLLLVCFVPVRYKLKAEGENADITGDASVTWFFGLARAMVSYKEKKVSYRVKIAWKTLIKGVAGEDETEALREVLQEEEVIADPKQYEKVSKELQKAEEKAEKAEAQKEEKKKEKEEEKEQKKLEKQAKKEEEKKADQTRSFKEKIRERIRRFKELREKFETVKRIWNAETTKRARKHLKVEIINILNHMKPRMISGSISFGLEDPATTALIYGNVAPITEAVAKGKLIVTPEFYEKGIRLNLLIKGRIFLGYMLLCIARLYFDRDVQRVIKVIRRYLNG